MAEFFRHAWAAQYTQPPQVNLNGAYAPQNAVGSNADAVLFATQSDEQLASEARLFQQQGRTAQAQRVYLELQRRSLIRAQSRLAPPVNRAPPSGYPAYGSYGPNGALPASAMNPATRKGQNASAAATSDGGSHGRAGSPSSAQSLRQFPGGTNGPAAGGRRGSELDPPHHRSDRQSQIGQQWRGTAITSRPSRQQVPPEATRAPVETASARLNPGLATPAAGDSDVRMGEKKRAIVLDRQMTPPTPQLEQKSNGWRPAVTPLPAALVQGQPAARPAV